MRKVKFTYKMELQFSEPVRQHCYSLLAFPLRLPEQRIDRICWSLEPDASLQFQQDYFGNTIGTGRYDAPHTSFCFTMEGEAGIHIEERKPEVCLPVYRYPSAACRMNEPMQKFLNQCSKPLQMDAVSYSMHLMDCLHQRLRYESGSTMASTAAGDAFAQGCGVCQDYAQILITLCRENGIAARYVAGLISGEGATHAWVEVYDGKMWYGLDPTQNRAVDNGYLKLAQGRDSQDCRLNRGVFCGSAAQQQHVYVSMEEQEV